MVDLSVIRDPIAENKIHSILAQLKDSLIEVLGDNLLSFFLIGNTAFNNIRPTQDVDIGIVVKRCASDPRSLKRVRYAFEEICSKFSDTDTHVEWLARDRPWKAKPLKKYNIFLHLMFHTEPSIKRRIALQSVLGIGMLSDANDLYGRSSLRQHGPVSFDVGSLLRDVGGTCWLKEIFIQFLLTMRLDDNYVGPAIDVSYYVLSNATLHWCLLKGHKCFDNDKTVTLFSQYSEFPDQERRLPEHVLSLKSKILDLKNADALHILNDTFSFLTESITLYSNVQSEHKKDQSSLPSKTNMSLNTNRALDGLLRPIRTILGTSLRSICVLRRDKEIIDFLFDHKEFYQIFLIVDKEAKAKNILRVGSALRSISKESKTTEIVSTDFVDALETMIDSKKNSVINVNIFTTDILPRLLTSEDYAITMKQMASYGEIIGESIPFAYMSQKITPIQFLYSWEDGTITFLQYMIESYLNANLSRTSTLLSTLLGFMAAKNALLTRNIFLEEAGSVIPRFLECFPRLKNHCFFDTLKKNTKGQSSFTDERDFKNSLRFISELSDVVVSDFFSTHLL